MAEEEVDEEVGARSQTWKHQGQLDWMAENFGYDYDEMTPLEIVTVFAKHRVPWRKSDVYEELVETHREEVAEAKEERRAARAEAAAAKKAEAAEKADKEAAKAKGATKATKATSTRKATAASKATGTAATKRAGGRASAKTKAKAGDPFG
jgi:hypothetical protein